jgi:hypothetical protein
MDFELMYTADERSRTAAWISYWGRLVAEALFELQEAKDKLEQARAIYLVAHLERNKTGAAEWKGKAEFLTSEGAQILLEAKANATRNLAFAKAGLDSAREKSESVRAALYDRGYERRIAFSLGRHADDGIPGQDGSLMSHSPSRFEELERRAEEAMGRATDDHVVD